MIFPEAQKAQKEPKLNFCLVLVPVLRCFKSDWSQGQDNEDYWDIAHGKLVGQCRVHVQGREELFRPTGIFGALADQAYTGERPTVVLLENGKLDVRRDNFKEGPQHV